MLYDTYFLIYFSIDHTFLHKNRNTVVPVNKRTCEQNLRILFRLGRLKSFPGLTVNIFARLESNAKALLLLLKPLVQNFLFFLRALCHCAFFCGDFKHKRHFTKKTRRTFLNSRRVFIKNTPSFSQILAENFLPLPRKFLRFGFYRFVEFVAVVLVFCNQADKDAASNNAFNVIAKGF